MVAEHAHDGPPAEDKAFSQKPGQNKRAIDWKQIVRYYQAGIVNSLFGYGCFALLVALKLDMFVAQAIAHVLGTLFNYFTYSRYTFVKESRSPARFIVSYGVNYLLNLATLYGLSLFITSAYLAGFMTIVIVSILNFFILKRFVFRKKREQE